MILVALLLAADAPTASDIYRNCVPVMDDDYQSQLRDLACLAITTGGHKVAKRRDAEADVQRMCLPPGLSLKTAANKVRDWLRANPDRRDDGHAIAADALIASFPCPSPNESTP